MLPWRPKPHVADQLSRRNEFVRFSRTQTSQVNTPAIMYNDSFLKVCSRWNIFVRLKNISVGRFRNMITGPVGFLRDINFWSKIEAKQSCLYVAELFVKRGTDS